MLRLRLSHLRSIVPVLGDWLADRSLSRLLSHHSWLVPWLRPCWCRPILLGHNSSRPSVSTATSLIRVDHLLFLDEAILSVTRLVNSVLHRGPRLISLSNPGVDILRLDGSRLLRLLRTIEGVTFISPTELSTLARSGGCNGRTSDTEDNC